MKKRQENGRTKEQRADEGEEVEISFGSVHLTDHDLVADLRADHEHGPCKQS